MARGHLVLCGDSILDNGAYVGSGGRLLLDHLREFLPDWGVDFRATDGACCLDVSGAQLRSRNGDAEALVISVGGNDALVHADRLGDSRKLTFLDFGLTLAESSRAFGPTISACSKPLEGRRTGSKS